MFNPLLNWLNSLPSFLIIGARISGMFLTAPVFSSNMVPTRIKTMLMFFITITLMPILNLSIKMDVISASMFVEIMLQMLFGVMVGLVLHIVFEIFYFAGEIVSLQSGLGFATLLNPQSGLNMPIVSQIYSLAMTLIFLLLNGHLMLIKLISDSFMVFPSGIDAVMHMNVQKIIHFSAEIFSGSVSVTLPAIVGILIVNIMFGVMTRSASQFNIISIGFPITLVLGLVMICLTFQSIADHLNDYFSDGFTLLMSFLKVS